ncbi:3-isopropylmalate dehydrogenase [Helicobacter didelphidarum]|uniref:3-isopropylmalate dehydrogenase n=1 Tax=Helicobacter didelphidarum TaxID=2040648 RepID=A0A3D8IR05_9HELI|nr:3-isopropylmalate dehydrogenase [Helicobacter didelphidarum]RDU67543.1 3-isopropylmalate dehydrogenase [Helicobacter didelphidarum]
MKTYNIAVLKGDGIGIEVTNQSLKVLDSVRKKFNLDIQTQEYLVGGSALDNCNQSLPEATIEGCKSADAVLFGAIGGPKWDNLKHDSPEKGLLELRKTLQVFVNIRPAFVFDSLVMASTLKPEVISGVDLVVVRELISGIYFGEPRGIEIRDGEKVGFNTMFYTESEISRIAHYAFKLANTRQKKLCVVDKANVLEVSKLWREVVGRIAKQYNHIDVSYQYVDNASMQLIRNPKDFDVILTSNLFGDILSDEASQLTGSIGLLPSASIGDKYALYEPIHGSAPDIAGQDIANPMASILSLAMMFENTFEEQCIAKTIKDCVSNVLEEGVRSKDIAQFGVKKVLGCNAIGDLIATKILEY